MNYIGIIGDIHGCYYTLKKLIEKVRTNFSGIQMYSVGDICDRGNFSLQCYEYLVSERIAFCAGNHDLMFYHYFAEREHHLSAIWSFNGNEKTLNNYISEPQLLTNHLQLIQAAPAFFNLPNVFISHAGISVFFKDILQHFENSGSEELLQNFFKEVPNDDIGIFWNRTDLADLGKLQVVGHTKVGEVIHNSHNNSLYIDTGACVGNKLTCAVVDDNGLIQIFEETTDPRDIA